MRRRHSACPLRPLRLCAEKAWRVTEAAAHPFVIPAKAGIHEGPPAVIHLPSELRIEASRKHERHESTKVVASAHALPRSPSTHCQSAYVISRISGQ
jgi:hypothetical protein